jgi:glycosyltransferase involved in cell wall biosynthesis
MSAYACDPEQGSESGAGWAMLQAASRIADHITVVTRANNAPALEKASRELPCSIEVVRITTPFDSSGSTYARYIAWLVKASVLIRRLSFNANVVHHVTFASDWMMPPITPGMNKAATVVWGPVGGNTYPPLSAVNNLGKSLLTREISRGVLTRLSRILTKRMLQGRISSFIALNSDAVRSAPKGSKVQVHSNCILDYSYFNTHQSQRSLNKKKLLFVGRLHEWKGVILAIDALEHLGRDWQLTLIGDGPAKNKANERALALNERISLLGACTRTEVLQHMAKSDVLIFPSLHDSAPWVAAEAAAAGLPVVCLNLGGVSTMAGANAVVIDARPVATLNTRLAEAVRTASSGDFSPQFDWTLESMIGCLESAYSSELEPAMSRISN